MAWRVAHVFGLALAVRLVLLVYGVLQDEYMVVKYTDVDYDVYTDASREIAMGNSPYDRTTYRYTPLLAFLLLPNVYLHESFGKLLFVASDLAVGWIQLQLLLRQGFPKETALKYTCVWLFHPFSINISTRGNADSIVVLLVLLTLHLICQKRLVLAAITYGMAVHFKIYPIVYALAFLVFLDEDYGVTPLLNSKPSTTGWRRKLDLLVNRERILFGLISGGLFLGLIAVFYQVYGFTFLYETYLYHFSRTDNRHNFSIYFYDLYLRYNTKAGFGLGVLAFLPQLATMVTLSLLYGKDIIFAQFGLTFCFVIFNKVCTAQYFLWYTAFFPLILPFNTLQFKWKGLALIIAFFGGELHWLYWAFYLEMKGQNTFYQLWLAGIGFFVANVGILSTFIVHQTRRTAFHKGQLRGIDTTVKYKVN